MLLLEESGTTDVRMKNSILKHVRRLIPWVRVHVSDPDGGDVSDLTLQYEDNFDLDRSRYYRLTDEQFLFIQLAVSTVALLYKEHIVGTIGTKDEEGYAICGDDFIELLHDLNELREEGGEGTYLKLNDTVKVMNKLVKQVKEEEELGKTLFRKKEKVARHYWDKALDTLSEYVKEYKKQAKDRNL